MTIYYALILIVPVTIVTVITVFTEIREVAAREQAIKFDQTEITKLLQKLIERSLCARVEVLLKKLEIF